MQFTKIRDVRSPEHSWLNSWIDFFIPNDFVELYYAENCKFTPSEIIQDQDKLKEDNFFIESEVPMINLPAWYGILIPSWIKIKLNDWNHGWDDGWKYTYDLVFDDKSWVCSKLWLINWAKVVDNNYRWEMHLHLINTSYYNVQLTPGMKITQAIIRRVYLPVLNEITNAEYENMPETDRWAAWFGSTDKK